MHQRALTVSGGGGADNYDYISGSIAGNARFDVPTTNKPKGIMIADSSGSFWSAFEGDTYASIDNVPNSAFPVTFGSNDIDFGRVWGSSSMSYKGFYIY